MKATVIEYNGKTVVAFERDDFGRVSAETQGGRTIRFEHDGRGRRTARVLPNGEITLYAYDLAGAVAAVEHGGQRIDIERDVLGRETKRHAAGGVEIASAYDAMDRLVDQNVSTPSTPGSEVREVLVQRAWRFDDAGRVRSIADTRWGTTLYEYDSVDQLIQARRGSFAEVFDYDGIGSLQGVLKSLEQRETAIPWEVGTGNVLHATKTADFTNDKNHRRRTMTDRKTGAVTEYLWDCRDRLRELRLPDGRRALYTYDAFGRRVRKEIVPKMTPVDLVKADGPKVEVTEFLWDGNALAAELDGEHGARVHVHAPGTLVPMLQAEQGEVFAVVNDHLGMPKELLGQDGRVAWAAAHSAWGRVVEVERGAGGLPRPVESPFRLLGQYADNETGLCCTRFRYFDATTGRWLSPDPLGIAGGRNLLAFDGAPTVDVDPLGLACEKLYHNLYPGDLPRSIGKFHLEMRDGKWVTVSSSGDVFTARGRYIFVTQDGVTTVARNRAVLSGKPEAKHFDVSGGGPVEYAGEAEFTQRGQVRRWDNNSGHYQPDEEHAEQAGLPMNRFQPVSQE